MKALKTPANYSLKQYALFLVVLILSFQQASSQQIKKRALIVAVENYPEETGWKKLNALKDVYYIKTALLNQGFKEADIDTLVDAAATKANILKALDKLVSISKPGDIVVFHFSGHGQQIFDNDNDEYDGFDEALIPYDAKAQYDANGYKGENHLRDDDLATRFRTLRNNIGKNGSFLTLIDACHSGTASRGQDVAVVRGVSGKFAPAGYNFERKAATGDPDNFFDEADLANMVVISACSADQLNYETKDEHNNGVGSLSYAFSRAVSKPLSDNGDKISYKILFEKIRNEIQQKVPFQSPQIEGNTNQEIFGGKFINTDDIIKIEKWDRNDSMAVIPRGTLHGISKGAEFKIFPVDVLDYEKSKPITTGRVVEAGLVKSTIVFKKGSVDKKAANKVVFNTKSYGDMNVVVKLKDQNNRLAPLQSKLSKLEYVSLNKPNADILVEPFKNASGKTKLQAIGASGVVLWESDWNPSSSEKITEQQSQEILAAIKRYNQAKYLRSVETGGRLTQGVSVEIVPVEIDNNGMLAQKPVQGKTNGKGEIEFTPSDKFILKVKNSTNFAIYFSVLDIMPDDKIHVLIPDYHNNRTSAEYIVQPGKTFETDEIELAPPYGKEFFKVIITPSPLELGEIGVTRGGGERSTKTSFEDFFNESFKDEGSKTQTRSNMGSVNLTQVGIFSLSFNIKEKK